MDRCQKFLSLKCVNPNPLCLMSVITIASRAFNLSDLLTKGVSIEQNTVLCNYFAVILHKDYTDLESVDFPMDIPERMDIPVKRPRVPPIEAA
jgi:hypothetical protein